MGIRRPLSEEQLADYIQRIEPLKKGFDALADHTFITDKNANILYANKALEQTTGFSIPEIIGKNPGDLWGGHMPQAFYEKMWHIIKNEKRPFVSEVQNKRKDGTSYWQEFHISPVLDKRGEGEFFIGIEPDITDRKERERFKEEFVSILGHQLQNPLGAIRWLLELLKKRGGLMNQQSQLLGQVYEKDMQLIGLVKDLLEISRIGNIQSTETVDLGHEIQIIVDAVQKQYPDVTSIFERSSDACTIQTKKTLALEAFSNIISNAAEYSRPGGQVTVRLSQEKDRCVFSCEDNGIGIPQNEQKHIFTKLFRASNTTNIKKTGTGLGLFIVKMITDNLGWELSFTSTENIGTTFFVKIPVS